jgi:hypothetical protein
MSNESLLKKEFKQSDVQRVRNIVNKDFTSSTKLQSGYQKQQIKHSEGEIWEENGKQWTIKQGLKQNITKLDEAKKSVRVPLSCPNCGGEMKHPLAKKMFKIHGFCFDPCTVKMESALQKVGLYEQYEKRMLQGNLLAFADDMEAYVLDAVSGVSSYVTEAGDVEDWNQMPKAYKDKVTNELKGYLKNLRTKI